MFYIKKLFPAMILLIASAPLSVMAGGWDLDKGPEIMTIRGTLVCVGCSLRSTSGSNAQCGVYTTHNIGLRMGDGSLWNFVNNQTGHDIIFAHNLLNNKDAKITGFLYPMAHMIEILSIEVKGISEEQIAEAALHEDRLIGKALIERKKGEAPAVVHYQMPDEDGMAQDAHK